MSDCICIAKADVACGESSGTSKTTNLLHSCPSLEAAVLQWPKHDFNKTGASAGGRLHMILVFF